MIARTLLSIFILSITLSASAFTCFRQVGEGKGSVKNLTVFLSTHSNNRSIVMADLFAGHASMKKVISSSATCKSQNKKLNCWVDYEGGEFEIVSDGTNSWSKAKEIRVNLISRSMKFVTQNQGILIPNTEKEFVLKRQTASFCNSPLMGESLL